MKAQDRETFQKYYDYMQSVTPRLIEAENTVKEIKQSEEWKRAFNYFQTLYTRGKLAERPTSKNGYKIEAGSNLVRLQDIKDILTPEQLKQIEAKAIFQ